MSISTNDFNGATDYSTPARIYQISARRAQVNISVFMEFIMFYAKQQLFTRLNSLNFPGVGEPSIQITYSLDSPFIQHEVQKKDLGFIDFISENEEMLGLEPRKEKTFKRVDLKREEKLDFRLYTDTAYVIDNLHVFEKEDTLYFGVEDRQFYRDTIVPLYFIMKVLDFGGPASPAYNIFYPVFKNIWESREYLYNLLLGDASEGSDIKNEYRSIRRRSARLFQRLIQEHSLGVPD